MNFGKTDLSLRLTLVYPIIECGDHDRYSTVIHL
jgi:hypothetical protein